MINTYLSDLFFAHDKFDAELFDFNHRFIGYDEKVLVKIANDFIQTINAFQGFDKIGVPDAQALVQDFLERI